MFGDHRDLILRSADVWSAALASRLRRLSIVPRHLPERKNRVQPTDDSSFDVRRRQLGAAPVTQSKPPSLFRPLPVQVAAGSQYGDPFLVHWRGSAVFTVFAAFLVAGLIGTAAFTDYAPLYRLPAYVDTIGGLVRVRAPADGFTVKQIRVVDGALVQQGDPLAVLAKNSFHSDGRSQSSAIKNSVAGELSAIARELNAAREEALAQHGLIDKRLIGFHDERDSLLADIEAGRGLLDSLREQSEQVAAVAAQGFATRMQAAQKRDDVTLQATRVAASRSALARLDRDIQLAQAERRLINARLSGIQENRQRSRAELDRLMVVADVDAERVIHAPESGTVTAALISQGQSLALGDALFTIRPQDQPLILRLLVPARAVASVKPGVAVKFTLRAYPQEKFGQFQALVESVSDSPAMSLDARQGDAAGDPVFTVVAKLPQILLQPDGSVLSLKAGMVADALVPIERRTVLEWMFEPVMRGFNESAGRAGARKVP